MTSREKFALKKLSEAQQVLSQIGIVDLVEKK